MKYKKPLKFFKCQNAGKFRNQFVKVRSRDICLFVKDDVRWSLGKSKMKKKEETLHLNGVAYNVKEGDHLAF